MKLKTSQPASRDYSIQALQQGMQVLDALLELRTPLSLEQIYDILVSPLFTRFSRKADYIGFIRC